MSLENDVTQIQEADVFKPASKAEVKKRQKDRPYKRFYFPVTISGMGYSLEEAWEDAVEQFCSDPGHVDDRDVEITAQRVDPETMDEIGPEEKVNLR